MEAESIAAAATASYGEALAIYKDLAVILPRTYTADVAMTLNYLGNFLRNAHSLIASKEAFEDAAKIYREPAAINPQACTPQLATTLNNPGNLLLTINDLETAKETCEEALQIRRNLTKPISKSMRLIQQIPHLIPAFSICKIS